MTFVLTYKFGDATNLDKLFTSQLEIDLEQISTQLNSDITDIAALQADVTTLQSDVAALEQDFISGIIASPTNKDYRIIEKLPFGVTLTAFTAKTLSGTITATLKINTTAVTNGAINVTSSQASTTPSAANVASAGDVIVITGSSNSSAVDLSFTLVFTRT